MSSGLYSFLEALEKGLFLTFSASRDGPCSLVYECFSPSSKHSLRAFPPSSSLTDYSMKASFLRSHMTRLFPPGSLSLLALISKSLAFIIFAESLLPPKLAYSQILSIRMWTFLGAFFGLPPSPDYNRQKQMQEQAQLTLGRHTIRLLGEAEVYGCMKLTNSHIVTFLPALSSEYLIEGMDRAG